MPTATDDARPQDATKTLRSSLGGVRPTLALILPLAAMAGAAAVCEHTAVFLYAHHADVPDFDQWALWNTLGDVLHGTVSPGTALFASHNEHRIALVRVLFVLDVLTGGRDYVLQSATMLAQAASAVLLITPAIRSRNRRSVRTIASATIIAMLFSLRQGENFTAGFQFQFTVVFTLAILGMTTWTRSRDLGWRLMTTLPVVIIAPFSMANGWLLGPCLAIVSLIDRRWLDAIAIGGATALLSVGLIASGFGTTAHPIVDSWSTLAVELPVFTAAYLGGIVTSTRMPWAETAGAIGLLTFLWITYRVTAAAPRTAHRRYILRSLGVCGFVIATALITAVGRLETGWSVGEALAGRYATSSSVFWCAIIVGAINLPRTESCRFLIFALCVPLIVLTLRDQHSYDKTLAARADAARRVAAEMKSGAEPTFSDVDLKAIGLDRAQATRMTDLMRCIGKGPFSSPEAGFCHQ